MQYSIELQDLIKNTIKHLYENTDKHLGTSQDKINKLKIILNEISEYNLLSNSQHRLKLDDQRIDFIESIIFDQDVSSELRFRLTTILSILRDPKTPINQDYSENERKASVLIDGKIKQLEKRQSTLLNKLDEMFNSNEKTFSDYERKLTLTFNKKLEEFDNVLSARIRSDIERTNKASSDIIEISSNTQQAIHSKASELEASLIASINVSQLHARNEYSELKNDTLIEINKRIKNEISIFINANKQLNKLLSAASNDVLAKDNLAQAERERTSANWLRFFGVLFLFCAVLYMAYEIVGMMNDISSVTIENVMIRVIITFVLMLPSIYLLKESSRHRADERRFRKTGINLATIDSYLSNFDETSKTDIKRQLTANFFDNSEQIVDYSTVPDIQTIIEKTIDNLMAKKNEDSNKPTQSKA